MLLKKICSKDWTGIMQKMIKISIEHTLVLVEVQSDSVFYAHITLQPKHKIVKK